MAYSTLQASHDEIPQHPDGKTRQPETLTSSRKSPQARLTRDKGAEADSRSHKRVPRNVHEDRLTADYRIGSDATKISVPTYDPKGDWRPKLDVQEQRAKTPSTMPGFRPRNTLDKPSPHTVSRHQRKSGSRTIPQKDATLGPFTHSAGYNVPRADHPRKQERTYGAHAAKRRKLQNSMIDLTDADKDDYFREGVETMTREEMNVPVSQSFVVSQQPKKDPFETMESRSVDGKMLSFNENRASFNRRARGIGSARDRLDIGASELGARSPSPGTSTQYARRRPGTSGERLGTLDPEISAEVSRTYSVDSSNGEANQTAVLPPIALNHELYDSDVVEKERSQRHRLAQSRAVSGRLNGERSPFQPQPRKSPGTHDARHSHHQQNVESQTSIVAGRGSMGVSQPEPTLRSTFQRDTSSRAPIASRLEPPHPSPGLPKVSSNLDVLCDSDEDELAGAGRTIKKHASTPFARPNLQSSQASSKPRSRAGRRQPSPSDIKPTEFTRSSPSNGQVDKSSSTTKVKRPYEDAVGIESFYSASYILQSTTARLVYDGEEIFLFPTGSDTPARCNGRDEAVCIGSREMSKLIISPGAPLAVLKGALSGMSNGCICLAFNDYSGVEWFVERVQDINVNVVMVREVQLTLTNRYNHMVKDISVIFEKGSGQPRSRQAPTEAGSRVLQEHADLQAIRALEDEEIIYEDEVGVMRRPSARANMRGGSPAVVLHDEESTREKQPHPTVPEPRRRSARQGASAPHKAQALMTEKWSDIHKLERWSHPVVYPSKGGSSATVTFEDLDRLDEGQYLNDNLIYFAQRYIEEQMEPEHREQVHFFSSFFYSTLSTKNGKKGFNYDAVKRWTKKIDIFNIPFIVVPINSNEHWFVAIICNLPRVPRRPAGLDDVYEDKQDGENTQADANQRVHAKQPLKTGRALSDKAQDPASDDVDNVEDGDKSLLDSTQVLSGIGNASTKRDEKIKRTPSLRKYDTDAPTIMTLDPLGEARGAEIRCLKSYLKAEAMDKRGMKLDTLDLQGLTARGIPTQQNFVDCGVYLVEYINEFARNPRAFVDKILTREMHHDTDFADFSSSRTRTDLRRTILKLSDEQENERTEERLRKKAVKAARSSTNVHIVETTLPLDQQQSSPRPSQQAPRPTPEEQLTILHARTSPPREDPIAKSKHDDRRFPNGRQISEQDSEELEVAAPRGMCAKQSPVPTAPRLQTSRASRNETRAASNSAEVRVLNASDNENDESSQTSSVIAGRQSPMREKQPMGSDDKIARPIYV